jgi:DNA-binding protein H-NS
MSKTYSEMMQEIAALKQQAEALRRNEIDEVIGKIKDAIAVYGLTAADLGLRNKPGPKPRSGVSAPAVVGAKPGPKPGRKPGRPKAQAAVATPAASDTFEQMFAEKNDGSAVAKAAKKPAAKRAGKAGKPGPKPGKVSVIKYRDGDNTWVGVGKRPQWVRNLLAAGKTLQDLAVK